MEGSTVAAPLQTSVITAVAGVLGVGKAWRGQRARKYGRSYQWDLWVYQNSRVEESMDKYIHISYAYHIYIPVANKRTEAQFVLYTTGTGGQAEVPSVGVRPVRWMAIG